MNRLQCVACAALLQTVMIVGARGQDALAELYGHGVHAYFSGDMNKADELLTAAIDAGLEDPRAYYFRGLTHSRLGGVGSGTADFQQGATLEVNSKRLVNVAQALERIQGQVRVEIEKARQAARIAARSQQLLLQRARAEQGIPADAVPTTPMTPKAGVRNVPDDKMDPFTDGGALITGEKKPMPKDAAPAPPARTAPPASEPNPFGDVPVAPAPQATPPAARPAPAATDLFSVPSPTAPAAPAPKVADPFSSNPF